MQSGNLTVQNPLSCISSASCAFGYSCISGTCQKKDSPSTGGDSFPTIPPTPTGPIIPPPGNCGPDVPGMPPGYGGCASPIPDQPNRPGCTLPTCGHGWPDRYGPDTDCCGNRCCRYTTNGISCYCGDCPAPGYKECNQWCDQYKKSTGEISPACKGRGTCDECSECNNSGRCETVSGAPCHCAGGSSCADGLQCNGSGDCVEKPFVSCCYHTQQCDCEATVTRRYCDYVTESSGPKGICAAAKKLAIRACKKECQPQPTPPPDPEPDPCEGSCSDQYVCYPSGNPEDGPPDMPGFNIKNLYGFAQNDDTGEICWFINACDMTDIPDECKECDCNCNNDCPYCKLCGADGECHDDPSPDCACGDKPKCGGSCCPENSTCIQTVIGDSNTNSCCSGKPLMFYTTKVKVGGGAENTFITVGPGRITGGDVCIGCSGNTVPCGQSGARPTFKLLNERRLTNYCLGSVSRNIAYQDFVATEYCATSSSWSPIDFPSVISATPYQTSCCSA